ncbi:MAG TPA: hypothetical protein VEJ88_03775 [Dissulfurispiraceae bacterium]|nr:hypothetical protein [Dissulfurispiraceae bacterium]
MPFIILFLLILLTSQEISAAAEIPYSAIVTAVKGETVVLPLRAQKEIERKKLDLGYLLYPGDKVETENTASLTVYYLKSGIEEGWPGGMRFIVQETGSKPSAPRIKRKESMDLAQIVGTQIGGTRLRGFNPEPVNVLSNTVIIEDRPTFRWGRVCSPGYDGVDYAVTLYHYGQDSPLWRKGTKFTEMPFPSDEKSLEFASEYEWQLAAIVKGELINKNEKRKCFALLEKEKSANIREVVNRYKTELAADPSNTVRRFDLIFFLAQHRLYCDVFEQCQELGRTAGESESLKNMQNALIQMQERDCSLFMK